jgi:hypothetical protein
MVIEMINGKHYQLYEIVYIDENNKIICVENCAIIYDNTNKNVELGESRCLFFRNV